MRSIFFPAVMAIGLTCSHVPHAHAMDETDMLMMQWDIEDMQADVEDMHNMMTARNPAPRYVAPPPARRHYWLDAQGGYHNCNDWHLPMPWIKDYCH